MKHIYLIRHARQDSRECNVNVPLSREGREQSRLLRDRLSLYRFDKMYSSTLLRAMETADIINERHGMDIERRSELNEIDWGDLTGLTVKDMFQQYGDFLDRRAMREEDVRFPGGENAEDVCIRALKVFDEIADSEYQKVLVVTHGGLIRAVIAGLLGLRFSDYLAFGKVLENTSITEFAYDEKSCKYTLERLNDHSHLDGHPELVRSAWKLDATRSKLV